MSDYRVIADGLFPGGMDPAKLTEIGREEVRNAVDALLRLWDRDNARLALALEQLDRAAAEIERLKAGPEPMPSSDRIYIVMNHGAPCAAFSDKRNAWKYSVEIGGLGADHAIAIVALKLDDPARMPSRPHPSGDRAHS